MGRRLRGCQEHPKVSEIVHACKIPHSLYHRSIVFLNRLAKGRGREKRSGIKHVASNSLNAVAYPVTRYSFLSLLTVVSYSNENVSFKFALPACLFPSTKKEVQQREDGCKIGHPHPYLKSTITKRHNF